MTEIKSGQLGKKTRMTETSELRAKKHPRVTEKWQQLLHTKGCSVKALHDIAKKLAGDDEQLSYTTLLELNQERFSEVKRAIVLPLVAGGEHRWEVADPSLLVAMSVRISSEMEEVFVQSLRAHQCSAEAPWSLVVTWDEFTPGNPLQPHDDRKAMVTNFSFLELLGDSDNTWRTMAVARTTKIKEVKDGWSRMLRDLLRLTLGGPSGMQTAGIPLKLKGEFVSIHARVVCLLSDGDGLRQAMQWNGAASLKPCFRHWNLVKKNHSLSENTDDKYVAVDCWCSSKFQVWSESEWRTTIDVCVEAQRQWASGDMTRSRLGETQKALGFKASEDGLLADPELRLRMNFIDVLRYDWAHTFLADSIVGREMWGLIEAAERHFIFSQHHIYDFLSEPWEFASSSKTKKDTKWSTVKKIFHEVRRGIHEDHRTIKANMGDLLGLYALLRHFVESRVPDTSSIVEEVHLFQLTCKAVDLVLAAKKRRVDVREAGAQLLLVLEEHLKLHVKVHGNGRVAPKFHWAFDIAECMVADGFVVDAFTLERLHLRVKAIANHCKNLNKYEASVMTGVTSSHLNNLVNTDSWPSGCNLVDKVASVP